MLSRGLAIFLAVLGLHLCALDAAAQPRGWGGGWRGGGGFPGRYAGPGFGRGGFRPGGLGPGLRRAGPGGFSGYPGFAGPRPVAPPVYGGYGGAPPGFGDGWRGEQDEVRRAVREGRNIPLSRAIQAVRRRAPGRELDAGLEPGPNGRPVYRLRWAGQNGRRQDYVVDAGTGKVLGVQGGP